MVKKELRKTLPLPKKRQEVSTLMKIILRYSAIKIKAKGVPLYSTFNPETISDSPSAKSKGLRLVSARQVINQTQRTGKIKKPTSKEEKLMLLNSRHSLRMSADSIISDIETS